MVDRLNATLQENVITLLCYDDEQGKLVANLIDPNLFEGDYRIIAERAVEYWFKHSEAPKNHTPDLVAEILEDPHNRKGNTYRRILTAMAELAGTVNTDYVLDQLRTFTRMQKLKDAILRSAEQLNAKQETAIEEVEKIWNELLHVRDVGFEPGLNLTDVDTVISYLQQQQTEFKTGIKELDQRHIVPYRGAVMLMIGATGRGKTWFLINTGKQGLLQRKRVLHISLEMSEEQVAARYYQALFGAAKRDKTAEISTLDLDGNENVSGLNVETVDAEFTLDSGMVRDELEQRINRWGQRLHKNIIIKRFPSLTPQGLEAYLDNLEIAQGFIPDLIILDYIGLMKVGQEKRTDTGRNLVEFRSICIERNMAGVTAQQSSKIGAQARTITLAHTAEDWSLTNTADIVLTFSATDMEYRYGLGRIYVGKARDEEDKFGVLITQNYKMGQFVLESAYLHKTYWELVKELEDDSGEDKGEEDRDDD